MGSGGLWTVHNGSSLLHLPPWTHSSSWTHLSLKRSHCSSLPSSHLSVCGAVYLMGVIPVHHPHHCSAVFCPFVNTVPRGATLLADWQAAPSSGCIGASWNHMELSGTGCVQFGAASSHRSHPYNHPATNTLTLLLHRGTKVSVNCHLCPKNMMFQAL